MKIKEENRQASWEKMKTANVVSFFAIVFVFVITLMLFFVEIPAPNKEVFISIISYLLGTVIGGAVFYLMGYKKGNQTEIANDDHLEIHSHSRSCQDCGKTISDELH